MNLSLVFSRIFFFILSVFFITIYMIGITIGDVKINAIIGVIIGAVFAFLLFGFDILFRRFNLRSFNIAIIGLFIGYLMGQALVLILNTILTISAKSFILAPQILEIIKIALFLFGLYLGTLMTLRASDELYISIPFVKFTAIAQKKKDLLIDSSILADTRIIDLSASGLLDHHLVIPRFTIKELYAQVEMGDEQSKVKAKRCIETLKKLEEIPALELRYNDTDFPEIKDQTSKLFRLARLLDANILTADISRIQSASIEGIKIINLHALSNSLKPLMQAGEQIKIKIQRYGKEPRQGVGYLEDGTMVVVNGGGDYIGEIIDAQVLSVKHTSSGRMIFCNTFDQEGYVEDFDHGEEERYEEEPDEEY
ncbi:MAG: putative PIN and TRAM-domain containing protein YacL [Candidatus Anoxychlamydiales bacterium]|nr:putative PIN and TRAM-domain containing protein YacL [Candidatus Anoxychlamydiales bacterium]